MAVTTGQVINNAYRITGKLGEGGMGAVFAAVHINLGKTVAIKVLLESISNAKTLQRFFNEARAASQINHPGIVTVLDVGQIPFAWMALEYLEGASLSARFAALRLQGRCMETDEILQVAGNVASALTAAHQHGIVHRDLKPSNIMVIPDRDAPTGERAKVLDFGIAKLAGDAKVVGEKSLTASGTILGTAQYMALEQFRDSANVDGKADVFSLGVILYEALSGVLPHKGSNSYEIMGGRYMDPIVPIEQFVQSVEPGLAMLIGAMLQREPKGRPTMAEVDLEIRRLRGLPPPRQTGAHLVKAAPPSLWLPSTEDAPDPLAAAAPAPGIPANQAAPDAAAAAPVQAIPADQTAPRTPSSEKALGELSPRHLIPIPPGVSIVSPAPAVPISIGSQPSIPVELPAAPTQGVLPLGADPAARTLAGAPPVLPAALVASPSSPTMPQPGGRRRYRLGVAVALGVAICASAAVALWPRHRPTAKVTAPVEQSQPPFVEHAAVVAPPPAAPQTTPATPVAPPVAASSKPAAVDTPVAHAPAAKKRTSASTKHRSATSAAPAERTPAGEKAASTSTRQDGSKCQQPQVPTSSCILTPMPASQRSLILAAFADSHTTFCPGERLIVAGIPNQPQIRVTPPSLSDKDLLIAALRGLLTDVSFPAEIEIRCRP